MEQLHFVLRSKHCRKVVSREQLVVLPSPAGTPGMATGKESHAAMGTHIGNNPGQPSSFWLWVCARVCRGLCCAAGSPSSQPCPAPSIIPCHPRGLSRASFVCYASRSQHPLSLLSNHLCRAHFTRYLRVHSHPPLGHLLMSLSATLSLANIIVGDNNIAPEKLRVAVAQSFVLWTCVCQSVFHGTPVP